MGNFYKLIILFSLIFLVGYTNPATPVSNSPIIVKVGIQLLGIDQLDLYKGSYGMDYHLVFTCSRVCPAFNIEVVNGSNVSVKSEDSTPTRKIYRIKSSLQENFNAKDYPFDSYWLRLEINDQLLDKSKVIFVPDPALTIVDPKVIIHGWQYHFNKEAITVDYVHPLLKTVYSEYIFAIQLQRPMLMGFLKVIFPAIIIILCAFISFIIGPERSINRFGIVSGSLLGSVIFHLNLTSSLPPLGYLTFADTFMLINYLILLFILFENLYVMRLVDHEEKDHAVRIDHGCMFILPLLWIVMQILNAVNFLG